VYFIRDLPYRNNKKNMGGGGEDGLTARGDYDCVASAATIASHIFDASGGDVSRSKSGSHSGPSAASKPTYRASNRGRHCLCGRN
jgi:hypothetical protein